MTSVRTSTEAGEDARSSRQQSKAPAFLPWGDIHKRWGVRWGIGFPTFSRQRQRSSSDLMCSSSCWPRSGECRTFSIVGVVWVAAASYVFSSPAYSSGSRLLRCTRNRPHIGSCRGWTSSRSAPLCIPRHVCRMPLVADYAHRGPSRVSADQVHVAPGYLSNLAPSARAHRVPL